MLKLLRRNIFLNGSFSVFPSIPFIVHIYVQTHLPVSTFWSTNAKEFQPCHCSPSFLIGNFTKGLSWPNSAKRRPRVAHLTIHTDVKAILSLNVIANPIPP